MGARARRRRLLLLLLRRRRRHRRLHRRAAPAPAGPAGRRQGRLPPEGRRERCRCRRFVWLPAVPRLSAGGGEEGARPRAERRVRRGSRPPQPSRGLPPRREGAAGHRLIGLVSYPLSPGTAARGWWCRESPALGKGPLRGQCGAPLKLLPDLRDFYTRRGLGTMSASSQGVGPRQPRFGKTPHGKP